MARTRSSRKLGACRSAHRSLLSVERGHLCWNLRRGALWLRRCLIKLKGFKHVLVGSDDTKAIEYLRTSLAPQNIKVFVFNPRYDRLGLTARACTYPPATGG